MMVVAIIDQALYPLIFADYLQVSLRFLNPSLVPI